MANHITKAEREKLIATCRGHLAEGMPGPEVVQVLLNQGDISRDRARSAVAKAQRRIRGEEVQARPAMFRVGILLDDASMMRVNAIEAATGIPGTSAVVREALKRMEEGL